MSTFIRGLAQGTSKFARKLVVVSALAIGVFCFVSGTSFGAVVLSYQGNTYTKSLGPYDETMSVSGSLTISDEAYRTLANGVPRTDLLSGTILRFEFSDGINVLSSDTPNVDHFNIGIGTDTDGNIVEWFIFIRVLGLFQTLALGQATTSEIVTINNPGDRRDLVLFTECVREISGECVQTLGLPGTTFDAPGVWTRNIVGTIPEPATFALFVFGLAGLSFVRWQWRVLHG